MRKFILWFFLIIIAAGGGILAWHIISPYKKINIYDAIPAKPVFVVETNNSYEMWEKLTKSKIWGALKNHSLFSKFGEGIDAIDTIIKGNEMLAKYIGKRNLLVSMHMQQQGMYDFIYIIDLQRISKMLPARDLFGNFLKGYEIRELNYNNIPVYKIINNEKDLQIYLTFKENLLIASFSRNLVEDAVYRLDNSIVSTDPNFISISERLKEKGIMRFYINYGQLYKYMNSILATPDPYIKQLGNSLYYTGLSFDITGEDNLIACDGYTNYNDTIVSGFRAMMRSGSGKTGLSGVLPLQTATSLSLGFEKFTLYVDNIMANMEEASKSYKEYESSIKQVEKFLKINVRENLMSWVSDEVAMVHLAPMGLGKSNEFAILLKTRDIDEAKKNLDYISNQIKKRTPVRFNQVDYNGYVINYLSVKGLFKILLGKFFQKLDKPYYTFIGDYVVFSNHPQTLKELIDGVNGKKSLTESNDYKSFSKNFSRKSNILLIVNTPQFYNSLKSLLNASTWAQFEQNKENIICFPYIGFQLEESGAVFKTSLYVQFNETYQDQDIVIESLSDIPENSDTVSLNEPENTESTVNSILSDVEGYVSDDPNAKSYLETYSNGQIKVEFQLKDGFRNGDYTEYYENGDIKVKGQYSRDLKDGIWKIYDENGKLLQRVKFRDGKKI